MNADSTLIISLILVAALVVAALVWLRIRDREARAALLALHDQLQAQAESMSRQTQRLEEQLLDHERVRKSDHAGMSSDLAQRLGDSLMRQSELSSQLRADLTDRFVALKEVVAHQLSLGRTHNVRALAELNRRTTHGLANHQARFEQRQGEAHNAINETLREGMELTRRQVADALERSSEEVGKRVDTLTQRTDERLKDISGQVEKRLSEGFEKTTATFADVLTRLALIDEAQKKITELSNNVVSLQEVLSDKRSRGAFGEVQLSALVSNVLPANSYRLQHTLSNGRRADCVLFMPPPTGTIAVDSKFPLESYQRMTDFDVSEIERKSAARQFKLDVRAHIKAISERYIIENETSDGAIMFVPAEAVFAEIQAHHGDVVHEAHRARVWLASPTTLVAILNTARAVLKDEATRRQIHVIRAHLSDLASDFDRFRDRMDKLAVHIEQANRDVNQVNVSARKISARFETIEQVEMEGDDAAQLERDENGSADANCGNAGGDAGVDSPATGSG